MTCSYEEQTTGTLENQRKKMAFRLFLIDCTWHAFNSICLREAKIPSWRRLHANKPLRTECNCSLAPTNLLLCLALLLYFFKVQNKWNKFCFLCVQQELRHFLKTLHVLFGGVWGRGWVSADSSFRALTDMICLVQLNATCPLGARRSFTTTI